MGTSSGRVEGLSYRLYRQTAESEDVIVVYHGGGVNSAAGYDILARQLAAEPTLAVCWSIFAGMAIPRESGDG